MSRLVCLSDTHNKKPPSVPDGDVLVHAGDATGMGTQAEVEKFCNWYGDLPHKYKIFVAGNHDWLFETDPQLAQAILSLHGIRYLQDSGTVIDGVRFYGAPWQPEFCNWAFNLPRGQVLADRWALIPDDTQVLITHGPPAGRLDQVRGGPKLGCFDLRQRVEDLKDLRYHVFGHIHDSYGVSGKFVNAAICNERYVPINMPHVLDVHSF